MVGTPTWYICPLPPPGYTMLHPRPATVQAPRHRTCAATALTHRVAEVNIRHAGVTVGVTHAGVNSCNEAKSGASLPTDSPKD